VICSCRQAHTKPLAFGFVQAPPFKHELFAHSLILVLHLLPVKPHLDEQEYKDQFAIT
jgi:hypothetical protein